MNARDKLIKARTQLVLDQPFFGSLALRLILAEDEKAATAYTNGVVLGYNRAFIKDLSLEETKWLVAHEVMHLACLHHTRRANRDPCRWNVAADYAINGLLSEAGFKTPAGCLIDYRYNGKSAEAIYAMCTDPGQDKDRPGSDGHNNLPGEIRDAPGSASDKKQTEAKCQVNVAQAAQQAKSIGNLPAGLSQLIEDILHPKLDWAVLLRHFVEQSTRNDYSWLPPSRRYLFQGIYLPSLNSKELGRIVIAVDTSGSIDTVALAQFSAEISAVLEQYDTMIDVVYCDTQIQGHEQIDRQALPLKLKPVGGGGTDFRPVFDWVERQGVQPCCVVYLTDLECNRFSEHAPDYPVLWVQTGQHGQSVPFGEIVKMS
jgi:predicted metal-dependent peptidase